jgi:hypothetical protein
LKSSDRCVAEDLGLSGDLPSLSFIDSVSLGVLSNCARIQPQSASISCAALPSHAYSVTPKPIAMASWKSMRAHSVGVAKTPKRVNAFAASLVRKLG